MLKFNICIVENFEKQRIFYIGIFLLSNFQMFIIFENTLKSIIKMVEKYDEKKKGI